MKKPVREKEHELLAMGFFFWGGGHILQASVKIGTCKEGLVEHKQDRLCAKTVSGGRKRSHG